MYITDSASGPPHPLAAAFLNSRGGGGGGGGGVAIGASGKPPAPLPPRQGLLRARSSEEFGVRGDGGGAGDDAGDDINTHDMVSSELKEAAGKKRGGGGKASLLETIYVKQWNFDILYVLLSECLTGVHCIFVFVFP